MNAQFGNLRAQIQQATCWNHLFAAATEFVLKAGVNEENLQILEEYVFSRMAKMPVIPISHLAPGVEDGRAMALKMADLTQSAHSFFAETKVYKGVWSEGMKHPCENMTVCNLPRRVGTSGHDLSVAINKGILQYYKGTPVSTQLMYDKHMSHFGAFRDTHTLRGNHAWEMVLAFRHVYVALEESRQSPKFRLYTGVRMLPEQLTLDLNQRNKYLHPADALSLIMQTLRPYRGSGRNAKLVIRGPVTTGASLKALRDAMKGAFSQHQVYLQVPGKGMGYHFEKL